MTIPLSSQYTEDYYVSYFYSQYRYGKISILFIYFYEIVLKTGQNVQFYIELQWYSYFYHFSNWIIFYHFFSQISNLCFLYIFCHNFLRKSKNSIKNNLDFNLQKHTLFDICWSSCKKKLMSVSINNPSSTTLIIYPSKKLPICHHIVNKTAQG